MANILIVITQAENAGAQKAVLSLYEYLKDSHSVQILYFYVHDQEYFVQVRESFKCSRLMPNRSLKYIFRMLNLRKFVRNEKIDIVVTYTHWPNIIIPFLLAFSKIKVVANKRGSLIKFPILRKFESYSLSLPWVKSVVCVSDSLQKEAIDFQNICKSKLIKIPNAIDGGMKVKSASLSSDVYRVLFIGRLHEQKGIHYLMKGFLSFNKVSHTKIMLTVCGDGPLMPCVKEFVDTNNLEGCVKILGNVGDVTQYYMTHDVLLSTSLWEGFPNVLLEAGAVKLPIIATRVDGSSELIKNGWNGILIPAKSEDAVAQALKFAVNNPTALKQYADNLYADITERYDHASVGKLYNDLIMTVSNESS